MAGDTKAEDGRDGESPLAVERPKGGRLQAWFADHGRAASDASLFVSQRLISSFLVWLMVGVALTLPGLLWIAQSNVQAINQQWQGSAGLTVYMKLAASQQLIDDMEIRLNRETGVERVIRTTPDQALQELLEQSDESAFLRDAMAAVGSNPLPASFAVVLNDSSSYLQLDALSRKLSAQTGVDDVVIEMTWLERLRDLSELFNRLGSGLSIMLLIAAVLVAFASVRLAIESRLGELRVLALIGATPAQMRRPFLYFGSAYGIGGGVMAIMLIAVFLNQIEAPLQSLLVSYRAGIEIAGFTPGFLLAILLVGWFLGVAGAMLALFQRGGTDKPPS
ncbi:MAG: hypothetical protein GWP45_09300 [Proteobacteria bacterium]|nr:hypothetical protein [Pseudomonadota bacterium]